MAGSGQVPSLLVISQGWGLIGSSTARNFPIPHFVFKGSLVDPRLRASNEHILIVRVPRAGGRPGYPSHPSEAARCASTEDRSAPIPLPSSSGIRRHEHEDFKTLICVILHPVLFTGRRQGPLPWTEHLFL
jgi:hypothetical protein